MTTADSVPLGTRSLLRMYLSAWRVVHAYNPQAVRYFAGCFLLALCAAAMAASLPYLLGKAIDSFHLGTAAFWLAPVAYALVWTAQRLLRVVVGLVAAMFNAVSEASMAQAIFDRRVTLIDPRQRSIELGKELATIDRAKGSFADITNIVFMLLGALAIEVVIGLTVFATKVDGFFSFCVALGVAILLWTAVDVSKRSRKAHRTQFNTDNVWKTWLTDRLAQARWARMYGAQADEARQAKASAEAYTKGMLSVNKAHFALDLYLALVAITFFGLIAASLIFAKPDITGGDFAALTGYALQMVMPMSQTAFLLKELQKSALALGDVDLPVRDAKSIQEPNPLAPTFTGPTAGDVLRIDGFRAYSSEHTLSARLVLNGALYAIKGESGAGKSCLLEALMAAFDPYVGSVSLNGVDLRELPLDPWMRHTCYVPASPIIINARSFRDNMVWGLGRAASDAELQATLERLKLAPYHRLDDVLGRQGRTLSSGEAQRLALARAMLRKPVLLLLDEPTANLDSESRKVVIDMLKAANATVVVATHDPGLLDAADDVFEFEQRDTVTVE